MSPKTFSYSHGLLRRRATWGMQDSNLLCLRVMPLHRAPMIPLTDSPYPCDTMVLPKLA
jgi:hypothetical protein